MNIYEYINKYVQLRFLSRGMEWPYNVNDAMLPNSYTIKKNHMMSFIPEQNYCQIQ